MARPDRASLPSKVATVLRLLGAAWLLGFPAISGTAAEYSSFLMPKWITATSRGDRAVLAWVHDQRFAVVRIYRATILAPGAAAPAVPGAPGAPGAAKSQPAPLNFMLVGETRESSFTDTGVASGGSYRYLLTAVGADGKEGRPSAEMSVRVGPRAGVPPVPPVWLGYLSGEKGVVLKWDDQEDADVIAYNVYRRTPPDTAFALLGSVQGTSFTDASVEPGKPVVYAATALSSSFTETPFSEELPVVYVPPPDGADATAPKWRQRRTWPVALVAGGDQPFSRPADVAVGPLSGNVYVADSGRNRVFVFTARGAFLRTLGGAVGGTTQFRRVVGLCVDREETVYAVDAGQGAVFAFELQGGAGLRLPLLYRARREAGLVDCAVRADGSLYVVDNSNDQVLLVDQSGAAAAFGAPGFGPGEFSAPTFCATGAERDFYVSDALNARVQVFSGTGEFVRAFGRARRGFGGMLRPKGLAIAPNGEIYVADSWQNSVQVFAATGEPLAILTDERGVPLDLGSPNGIAFGTGNRIYIAERLSSRLQIREIIDETR